MSKKQSKKPQSKRQRMREERRQKEQRQRLITIGAIVAVALLLVGLIAIPAIQEANEPVAEFIQITPEAYPLAEGTSMGDPDLPVVIQVFEDFKCSACQSYTSYVEPQVIKEIVEVDMAYYVFRQHPFLTRDDSPRAANASECAAEQGEFWNYKNLVFANFDGVVGEFSDKRLGAFAESLNLDMDQFNACYGSNLYQDKIDEDLALGAENGINATPTVLVNGVNVAPGKVPTFEQIKALVEKAVAESGG